MAVIARHHGEEAVLTRAMAGANRTLFVQMRFTGPTGQADDVTKQIPAAGGELVPLAAGT